MLLERRTAIVADAGNIGRDSGGGATP